jgi:hypothetical protein
VVLDHDCVGEVAVILEGPRRVVLEGATQRRGS